MIKFFEVLRKCSLFHDINDEDLNALLTCLRPRITFFDKKLTKTLEKLIIFGYNNICKKSNYF